VVSSVLKRTKATRQDGFLAAKSRSHIFIIDLWERLPAAIEAGSGIAGRFIDLIDALEP
jgi:hypothetical protein